MLKQALHESEKPRFKSMFDMVAIKHYFEQKGANRNFIKSISFSITIDRRCGSNAHRQKLLPASILCEIGLLIAEL
jgi:hypothetical protein